MVAPIQCYARSSSKPTFLEHHCSSDRNIGYHHSCPQNKSGVIHGMIPIHFRMTNTIVNKTKEKWKESILHCYHLHALSLQPSACCGVWYVGNREGISFVYLIMHSALSSTCEFLRHIIRGCNSVVGHNDCGIATSQDPSELSGLL